MQHTKRAGTLSAGALVLLVISSPAMSQTRSEAPKPAGSELFESLTNCRTITDDMQRLACFDSASASLSAAVDSKQVLVIEEQEVKRTKKSLFGFRLPDLSIFGGSGNDSEEDKTLVTTIKSVGNAGGGRWNIAIPEGAVWQTTETLSLIPAVGDEVTIQSGMMGGYFLKVRNRRSVRAKRIQ